MIECKLCGHKSKHRLIEHLVKTHKYDIDDYKSIYGPVITDEYKLEASNRSIKRWKNDEYRNKTNKARDASWTPDKRKRQSEITKKSYENGFKNWCDGLTKETDPRIKARGEHNRMILSGRTKEHYPYLEKHSVFMKLRAHQYWAPGGLLRKYFSNSDNFSIWRNKISTTVSRLYKEGILKFDSKCFKSGYYKNIFHASSLELEAMKWFDSEIHIKSWRKNFDIVNYIDKNGNNRRYLPDFELITDNDIKIVIETKGYPDDNLDEKIIFASKKYKYYFVCYTVDEIKNKIYEIIDHKKNIEI